MFVAEIVGETPPLVTLDLRDVEFGKLSSMMSPILHHSILSCGKPIKKPLRFIYYLYFRFYTRMTPDTKALAYPLYIVYHPVLIGGIHIAGYYYIRFHISPLLQLLPSHSYRGSLSHPF